MTKNKEKYHSEHTYMEFLNENILKIWDRDQDIEIALLKDELNWIYQRLKILKENLQEEYKTKCQICKKELIITPKVICRQCSDEYDKKLYEDEINKKKRDQFKYNEQYSKGKRIIGKKEEGA